VEGLGGNVGFRIGVGLGGEGEEVAGQADVKLHGPGSGQEDDVGSGEQDSY
jgi:hypothetical protein